VGGINLHPPDMKKAGEVNFKNYTPGIRGVDRRPLHPHFERWNGIGAVKVWTETCLMDGGVGQDK